MRFLQQYRNLSKEIYILFFGRIVTSMGSLIWPIMTLILKNKLGYSASTNFGVGDREITARRALWEMSGKIRRLDS